MGHKVTITDLVAIRHTVELPDKCPRCKAELQVGSTNADCWTLRPRREQLRLIQVTDGKKTSELVEVRKVVQDPGGEQLTRIARQYVCHCCGTPLTRGSHARAYEFAEMTSQLAFRLRTLLYDANVRDEDVRKKCFDETVGYHGDCHACNIEAEIGTEEVPHPVDGRLHTCRGR